MKISDLYVHDIRGLWFKFNELFLNREVYDNLRKDMVFSSEYDVKKGLLSSEGFKAGVKSDDLFDFAFYYFFSHKNINLCDYLKNHIENKEGEFRISFSDLVESPRRLLLSKTIGWGCFRSGDTVVTKELKGLEIGFQIFEDDFFVTRVDGDKRSCVNVIKEETVLDIYNYRLREFQEKFSRSGVDCGLEI